MSNEEKKQTVTIDSITVTVENPNSQLLGELEHAFNNGTVVYLGRFIYGIPDMVFPSPSGNGLLVNLRCYPDGVDPWMVTQDMKDELEEADADGTFTLGLSWEGGEWKEFPLFEDLTDEETDDPDK